MKKLFLLCFCFSLSTYITKAQSNFFYEMLYPMNGAPGAKNPVIDLVYGYPVVVNQLADTINPGNWKNVQKMISPKDANGRFTQFGSRIWDTTINNWVSQKGGLNFTFTYTYDTQNKLLGYKRIMPQNDTMDIIEKLNYTYVSGKPVYGYGIDSIHTPSFKIYSNERTDTFYYDGNSRLSDFITYRIVTNGAVQTKTLDRKFSYIYNALGQIATYTDQTSSGSGSGIQPVSKSDYTYNTSGWIASSENYRYQSGAFQLNGKEVYTYLAATNKMTKMESYKWDVNTSAYIQTSITDFTYNSSEVLISIINRDLTVSSGVNNSKWNVTYDGLGNPTLIEMFRPSGSGWVANPYARYIYTDTVQSGSKPAITLGPNPNACKGALNVSLSFFSPVNNPVTYSITWNAAALTAGFTNVVNAVLPASAFVISLPANLPVAQYSGTISVGNASGSNSYPFKVTMNQKPSITLGMNPMVKQGITESQIGYSAPAGNPVRYIINWDSTAISTGFVNTNGYLGSGKISIVIPSGAAVNTYTGKIIVSNDTCDGNPQTFQVVVINTPTFDTVMDIDGNVYHIIPIGTQFWTQENLRVTRYNNGNALSTTWPNINNAGAWCYYAYNQSNDSVYGKLYNWHAAANTANVCPVNWHVPSNDEYTILANFLGGFSVAGGKMKEIGTAHWNAPNTGADNSSWFSGLPGGGSTNGSFGRINSSASWLTTSVSTPNDYAVSVGIEWNSAALNGGEGLKNAGHSIRCVKNTATGMGKNSKDVYSIAVFPNPFKTSTLIRINSERVLTNTNLKVYDILGNVVKDVSLIGNEVKIERENLQSGIYFYSVFYNEEIIGNGKLIVD